MTTDIFLHATDYRGLNKEDETSDRDESPEYTVPIKKRKTFGSDPKQNYATLRESTMEKVDYTKLNVTKNHATVIVLHPHIAKC